MTNRYWITDSGSIIRVPDGRIHASDITSRPRLYPNPLVTVTELIVNYGWIRITGYSSNYSVDTHYVDQHFKDRLFDWASVVYRRGEPDNLVEIWYNGRLYGKWTIAQIHGGGMNESVSFRSLVEETSLEEILRRLRELSELIGQIRDVWGLEEVVKEGDFLLSLLPRSMKESPETAAHTVISKVNYLTILLQIIKLVAYLVVAVSALQHNKKFFDSLMKIFGGGKSDATRLARDIHSFSSGYRTIINALTRLKNAAERAFRRMKKIKDQMVDRATTTTSVE